MREGYWTSVKVWGHQTGYRGYVDHRNPPFRRIAIYESMLLSYNLKDCIRTEGYFLPIAQSRSKELRQTNEPMNGQSSHTPWIELVWGERTIPVIGQQAQHGEEWKLWCGFSVSSCPGLAASFNAEGLYPEPQNGWLPPSEPSHGTRVSLAGNFRERWQFGARVSAKTKQLWNERKFQQGKSWTQ